MSCDQMLKNMTLIFTCEELSRISFHKTNAGVVDMNLDLHGLNCYQAKKVLKNVINVVRDEFNLNVIHGYNHGTVLKEMVSKTDFCSRVIKRSCPSWNPGMTILTIAA